MLSDQTALPYSAKLKQVVPVELFLPQKEPEKRKGENGLERRKQLWAVTLTGSRPALKHNIKHLKDACEMTKTDTISS